MQSHSFPEYANVIITSSQEQSIKKLIGERATVQENPRPPKVNAPPSHLRGMDLKECVAPIPGPSMLDALASRIMANHLVQNDHISKMGPQWLLTIWDLHFLFQATRKPRRQHTQNIHPKYFFAQRLHRRGSHQNSVQLVAAHIVSNFY